MLDAEAGEVLLEGWAELAALMTETDELGGLQFLEVRSSFPTNCSCMRTNSPWLTVSNCGFLIWIRRLSNT